MMEVLDGRMTVNRNGRTVELQRITDETYFAALRTYGVREAAAAAAAAGLITVYVKGSK